MPTLTQTESPDRRSNLSAAKQALLAKWTGASRPARPPGLAKRADPSRAPLSFGQQRLWFLEQLVPDSSVYNMHDAVRIRGRVDTAMLQRVLTVLTERHETLRTAFVVSDGQPQQVIAPPQPFSLPIEDLEHLPTEEREKRAREILAEETRRPFDLDQSPLFRARLVRVSAEDQILVWTMHHIISDGWSLGVIIKEVLTLCSAFTRGQPNPLPPLATQFGDFCVWQQESFTRQSLAAQLDFWRQELGGEIPTVSLPTDQPRPAFPTYAGARRITRYAPELARGLNELARQENATLFMVLLSAFEVLLHRYAGVDRIFVGVPVANRNKTELHDLIGYFVNTLVLRGELAGNPAFRSLLRQVRETALAAYDRQDVPFEKLVEELHPERGLNKPPFFQVMFVLQNEPMPSVEEADLKIEPFEIHNGTSKFDLLLNVVETPHGLEVGIEYSTDVFQPDTIDRMLGHYRTILEGIVANADQRIGEIPLLDEAERRLVVETWNDSATEYPTDQPHLLHRFIEAQADRTPEKPALRFESTQLTYAELNRRANQLAHHLRAAGVGRDVIVAVAMERSIELVVALVAILKAGGAYLPLDLEYPTGRLTYMLEDSQAHVVLCRREVPAWAAESGATLIVLTGAPDQFGEQAAENPTPINEPADLAYVIYTSGSTGRPKGAMNTHVGICNRLLWMQSAYQLADDRVLQKTPFSFDVSVWEFFWPLMTGAELVVAPPGAHRDSAWLARIIQQNEITTLHFVPSMLQIFLSDPLSAGCNSLRRVICSGEALSYELQRQFFARLNCQLHNLYGPTEASVDVTFWDCSVDVGRAAVPIGRPIANTQMYILDRFMQPTPIGVPGELYIGGIGVGRGYLNRPELTAERFVRDPFRTDPGARLYRTGDLARFWNNGVIEFLGRIDHQVKIRGLRIELSEIEHALLQHPEVGEAVVVARSGGDTNTSLCAYLSLGARESEASSSPDADVAEWQKVFDDTYAQGGTQPEATQNIVGWNSSYTGQPFSREEMAEWVESSIDRIRGLGARRVLELGCGTGLLLFPLLDSVDEYVGTDISPEAIAYVRQTLESVAHDAKVELLERPAHNLSGFEPAHFDAVVIHSVAQYFPSLPYLEQVLAGVARVLRPGGKVFLGDLRDFNLVETFATSVEFAHAENGLTVGELRSHVRRNLAREGELSIDPRYFRHLAAQNAGFSLAEVMLRRGRHATEMVRFRYDAVLTVGGSSSSGAALAAGYDETTWSSNGKHIDAVDDRLRSGLQRPWRLVDVPNRRVWADVQLTRSVGRGDQNAPVRELLPVSAVSGVVDPEELVRSWKDHYDVVATPAQSGKPENFDAIFIPRQQAGSAAASAAIAGSPWSSASSARFANEPGRAKREARVIAQLKQDLGRTLPDYMVPNVFVVLPQLPLSPNGKIDRAALPEPGAAATPAQREIVAPADDREQALTKLWSELLNVSPVGVTDNFFTLGGHSLLAAQMIIRLRELLGRDVPLRALFQAPTIRGLLQELEQTTAAEGNPVWAQMQKDAFLPATMVRDGKPGIATRDANVVFLTGATGFLGAFLLRDLLQHTTAKVLCLVRARNEGEGRARLAKVLREYELIADVDFNRIEVVAGDLGQPRFGLTEQQFCLLAARTEAIYHCGAAVNFVSDYSTLRAANVGGFLEIIQLASSFTIKPLHLVSTIYTLTSEDAPAGRQLDESAAPRRGDRLQMGYLQTKWVAERLAEAARDRGVPVTIYRPGRIGGASNTGACQTSDFYWSLVRACIKMGCLPDAGLEENLAPVDLVSRGIVTLSRQPEINQTHHLLGRRPLPIADLVTGLTDFGYELSCRPVAEWRETALSHLERDTDDAAAKLGGFLFNDAGATEEPPFSAILTLQRLENLGIEMPAPSAESVRRQVEYFVRTGFFPAPAPANDVAVEQPESETALQTVSV